MLGLMLAMFLSCLVPADAPTPASGYCPTFDGTTVKIVETDGMPVPRCATVSPDQRLKIANRTGHTIMVKWADTNRTIEAGCSYTYKRHFGNYLAYGDHFISIRGFDGAGEIYLAKP